MKYILILLLMLPSYYLLSFAKYEWKNSKLSSIGSIILAIIATVFPAAVILMR